MPPVFLELVEVLAIHADQIKRYGGIPGIRDMGLLKSALAVPESGFGDEYFHADIYDMASAYLFHIVNNHPFIDGNKRTAAMSAYVFLKFNGITLTASNPAFEKIVLRAADGSAGKPEIAHFFRKHTKDY